MGWVNAHSTNLNNLVSQGMFASLFVEYIPFELSELEEWAIRVGFVVFVVIINIAGVKWLSRISSVIMILVNSPFIALCILVCLNSPNWKSIMDVPPIEEVHWGILISTIVWANGEN